VIYYEVIQARLSFRRGKMRKLKGLIVFFLFAVLFQPSAFAKDLDLTILYDNNPYNKELETKWGFSCLVEGLEKTILFDVGGDGTVLLENMKKLNIKPEKVDVVVLSHIHHDHIGSLPDFLEQNSHVNIYIPHSFPQSIKEKTKKTGAKIIEVRRFREICPNAYTTGELGGLIKEESLVLRTARGLVIITGCAHPGITNIVKKAKEQMNSDVYLIVGGFHLCWMNLGQVNKIVAGIQAEGVHKVAPCHCSGDLARKRFEKAFGKDFILAGVGKKIKIEDAF
jgi:7,8-dihydropterin-6-yl-methyl-4-(beta-D-ribofuranosyl)aminobenzene 5'-phosphate synthase